ncbi:hypothetical protein [Nonomuraea zeae]|uniref:Type II toxin-antitoxin system Phd/YefM family antitoxin n=1 Tax=Nonomuraea zeae TaxID=1642303 RepID=A0A5S4GW08_9ACTN|nr:hypothetical protein [Nonomuraea zeae]TMR36949.1 hypothetical protein ETD85_09360 [Nonomuraea zeae]
MNADDIELTVEEARARLGDVANRADQAGQITYLTRNGRRVAAIVPLHRTAEAADVIVMTSVDLIAEETGATVENVHAAIEHVSALAVGESIVTSDDHDLVGMDRVALSAVYEQLGRTIRFIRSREDGERDTVTFTIKDLEITETSIVNGIAQTHTDTGAGLRDIDAYLNERATDLIAEGYSEDLPTIWDGSS